MPNQLYNNLLANNVIISMWLHNGNESVRYGNGIYNSRGFLVCNAVSAPCALSRIYTSYYNAAEMRLVFSNSIIWYIHVSKWNVENIK